MPLQPNAGHFGLILPLCTSSATVGLALFQYPVFLSFLQPNTGIAGLSLSTWMKPIAQQGSFLIATLGLTSSIAGAAAARWLRTHTTLETTSVSNWYLYGSALAAAHSVATAYLVSSPIKRIVNEGTAMEVRSEAAIEDINRREMQSWLAVHTARTLLLDLPALWCFAEGVALSFWVI